MQCRANMLHELQGSFRVRKKNQCVAGKKNRTFLKRGRPGNQNKQKKNRDGYVLDLWVLYLSSFDDVLTESLLNAVQYVIQVKGQLFFFFGGQHRADVEYAAGVV